MLEEPFGTEKGTEKEIVKKEKFEKKNNNETEPDSKQLCSVEITIPCTYRHR